MFRQILLCSLVCIFVATVSGGLAGGLSEEKDVTPASNVQKLVDHVKADLEERLRKHYDAFEAVSFRVQVVAGKNYFVKVHTGGDNYIHVRIFSPFSAPIGGATLEAYELDKNPSDDIVYFVRSETSQD